MTWLTEELGIASRWGWVVLRGVFAIVLGFLAFAHPGTLGLTLVLMFAGYAFVSGIATFVTAVQGGRAGAPRWGTLMLEALLSIGVGIVAVLWPATTALAFIWVLGAWAVISGVLEMASAVRLRKLIEHEWALGLAGLLSFTFGALLLLRPALGGLAVVWWLGAYAVSFGILMIVVGFRLRGVAHALGDGGHLSSRRLRLPG
jgi:uncharacterized membrane protein HdeD (DUF308 family)